VKVARPPRPAVTGRAIVLGTVVVLLLVLLASPLSRYFGSRGDVNSAAQQLQHDRERLGQLKKQQALWGDPGYIQQQARARLQYAMPGDTTYIVVGKGQQNEIARSSGAGRHAVVKTAWNDKLWGSISSADAAN
jgi:cell division protein FtsB